MECSKHRIYSEYEAEYLRTHYKNDGAKSCAEALGRSVKSIYKFCFAHDIDGSISGNDYTETEINYMKAHYLEDLRDVAKVLGRSYRSVRNKCSQLGLVKIRKWDNKSIEYLRIHYPTDISLDIANHLGRSVLSVIEKANKMNLTKCEEFREIHKERLSDLQSRAQIARGTHGIRDYQKYLNDHPEVKPLWEYNRGRKQTPEIIKKRVEAYRKVRASEERRARWGLPQKTKLKIKIK